MSRFYFDLFYSSGQTIIDDDGDDFEDMNVACKSAVGLLADLIGNISTEKTTLSVKCNIRNSDDLPVAEAEIRVRVMSP